VAVVVNTRDDFTLANFRRVCYGGEPVRLGAQARRAMAAGARRRTVLRPRLPAAAGPPSQPATRPARRAAPGAGFG
jgi:hypothetical protein